VPAVAVGALRASPFVVFGGFCADDLGWQFFSLRGDGELGSRGGGRGVRRDGRLRFSHADYGLAVGESGRQRVGVGKLCFLQGSCIFHEG